MDSPPVKAASKKLLFPKRQGQEDQNPALRYGDGTLRPVFKATAGGASSSAPSSASSSRPTAAGAPRKSVTSESAPPRAPDSSTSPKLAPDSGKLAA